MLSLRTETIGVNACWLPSGMFVGVAFTLIGVDQVSPPSVDRVSAMLERGPKLKRPIAQPVRFLSTDSNACRLFHVDPCVWLGDARPGAQQ